MKKSVFTIVFAGLGLVAAQSAIVLDEPFTYADGSLITVSGGLWATHSGTTPGQVDVTGNKVNITSAETEDVNRFISGGAGLFFNAGILTATFDATFSALPTAGGSYFAHFKDDGTSNFRGRVFATTTGAGSGLFRMGIADTTNTFVPFVLDLSLGTTYSVTLSLDVASGRSSLAINGGTPVAATDATSALNVSTFALRQSTGEGTLALDNLVVDASTPAVPEPSTFVSLIGGVGMLMGFRRLRGSYGSVRRNPAQAR
ncbi:MAG: PEP-CTERM sorting domain-containing protein [Chthoniobacteraceae bacterium]